MTIWYVRPNTSHSAIRDGKSYATAWGGWSEVIWGGAGVIGGDTLTVCGAHSYSANVVVGSHGGSSALTVCTITGAYQQDPGSITFTGSAFIVSNRPWTTIDSLSVTAGTSNCIYVNPAATNCSYRNNVLVANGAPHIGMAVLTGTTHSDILFDGNDFSGNAGNGAILWLPTGAGMQSVLQRITVRGNRFHDLTLARAAVHFRSDTTVDPATRMQDIIVESNMFERLNGKSIELTDGMEYYGNSAGVKVLNNTQLNCLTTLDGSMGGNSVMGFRHSGTPGFGKNVIAGNRATNIAGPNGFFNVFYGSYFIYGNTCDGVTTNTIDGNGILVDHGNDGVYIFGNHIKNCDGKAGVLNSGCGVMVLDSTNIHVFSNIIEGGRVGIWFSQAGGQSQQADFYHNTIKHPTIYGIFVGQYASRNAVNAKNNVFVGDAGVPFVYDQVAGGWTGEDHNCVFGFSASSNHTDGTANLLTDPMLDLATSMPAANSPCVGAGLFIDTTLTDFFGRRFARTPTVGATERRPRLTLRKG